MRIHDITRVLEPEAAAWPGDERFRLEWTLRMAQGKSVNLSMISGSPHVGTHADAPLHVRDGAASIDAVDLSAFLGPARVIEAPPDGDGLIDVRVLSGIDPSAPPRILLKTGTHPDTRTWPGGSGGPPFAALSPALAQLLARGGARLLGIDTPSLDPERSKDLPAHQALAAGGLVWLENLDLSQVAPGLFWMAALPLRIRGGDASPVRAVLIEGDPAS